VFDSSCGLCVNGRFALRPPGSVAANEYVYVSLVPAGVAVHSARAGARRGLLVALRQHASASRPLTIRAGSLLVPAPLPPHDATTAAGVTVTKGAGTARVSLTLENVNRSTEIATGAAITIYAPGAANKPLRTVEGAVGLVTVERERDIALVEILVRQEDVDREIRIESGSLATVAARARRPDRTKRRS
jgi:hypothetical protein